MSDVTITKPAAAPPKPKHVLAAGRALDALTKMMNDAMFPAEARVKAAQVILNHSFDMTMGDCGDLSTEILP